MHIIPNCDCVILHMENNNNNIKRRNVGIPVEIHKRLKNIATDNDTDLQNLITVIAEDFIKKTDKKVTTFSLLKNLMNVQD